MWIALYKKARTNAPPRFLGFQLKRVGYRVIHRAGCGAQPTHPRPALWITRMAPNDLGT